MTIVQRLRLSSDQLDHLSHGLPALLTGLISGIAFVWAGDTPLVRAAGLAAAVVGVALTLRRMGALMSMVGGFALAFSPAFWEQTGGASAPLPATIVIALGLATVLGVGALLLFAKRPYVAMVIGLAIFTGVFLSGVGQPRSLRLTVLASAWTLFLLTQTILEANPRPNEPAPARLRASYRAALLLILSAATLNDPLFVLWAPAIALGLSQSKSPLPWWYWAIFVCISALGAQGMVAAYVRPEVWGLTTELASSVPRGVRYLVAEGWLDGARWVDTFALLAAQFTPIGVGLGVLGVARMARWYPSLGTIMLVAYGCFFAFGLAYFGLDRSTLLLPLSMVQLFFITYAMHAIGQWLAKLFKTPEVVWVRWVMPTGYAVLPVVLLWQNIASL